MAKLGYNARVIEEGFNNKNRHQREAPFHGESLKHLLMSVKGDDLESWYNTKVNGFLKKSIAGRTRTYIIDGTHLKIPRHLLEKYPGAGLVKDKEGSVSCGYKIVWIRELIDQKGIIRALKFAPINRHDLDVGKELIKDFDFENDATLLMDRGFFDSEWFNHLHEREESIFVAL